MIDRNEPELPLDRRRILLVEGCSNFLSSLSLILFRAGAWDVWQAHNAARARELWREHSASIDVVIADENLPDGKGTDLLSEFRFEDPQLSKDGRQLLYSRGHVTGDIWMMRLKG